MRFRLIGESGHAVGELDDAEATWGVGDMVTVDGLELQVAAIGGRRVADLLSEVPILVVRQL